MIITFEQVNRDKKQHGPYLVYCSIIHIHCLKCCGTLAKLVRELTYEQDVCKVQVEHVRARLSDVMLLVVLVPSFTPYFLHYLSVRSVYSPQHF
jgi:hypothetical protein